MEAIPGDQAVSMIGVIDLLYCCVWAVVATVEASDNV